MKSLKLFSISVLSAALLSACASGKGSFELDNVSQGPVANNGGNGVAQPSYQDDNSNPRRDTAEKVEEINQPALGYMTDVPRRNTFPKPTTGTAEANAHLKITPDKVKTMNVGLDKIEKYFTDKLAEHSKHDDSYDIDYSHNKKNEAHKRDWQYVRSGYVLGNRRIDFANRRKENGVITTQDLFPGGWAGYVFYQGINPARELPTQKATYKGYWDFVSDAKKERTDLADGFTRDNNPANALPGSGIGATSMDEEVNRKYAKADKVGHSAEFEVDFASKKVSGSLKSNGYIVDENKDPKVTERYKVDAKIEGNRFRGSATAVDKRHDIFGQDSKNLEGGFFGDKAEELAGKFLADDHSLFAVFGAKRDNNNVATETLFDAEKIDASSLKKSTMDTFGNVTYLVVDGKVLSLLPADKTKFADMEFNHTMEREHQGKKYSVTVCCNNLDYVKFGSYGEKHEENGVTRVKNGQFFLQGERTHEAAMEGMKGTAHYRGTWEANIVSKSDTAWSTSASNSKHGSRALFDFNFDNKTFTGKLIGHNGVEENPAFNLSGNIEKNGFKGTAKTADAGFNIDPQGKNTMVNFVDAEVKGGFFGANAAEIGGTIHSAVDGKDKIGGVFGGKRQIVK